MSKSYNLPFSLLWRCCRWEPCSAPPTACDGDCRGPGALRGATGRTPLPAGTRGWEEAPRAERASPADGGNRRGDAEASRRCGAAAAWPGPAPRAESPPLKSRHSGSPGSSRRRRPLAARRAAERAALRSRASARAPEAPTKF